MSKELSLLSVRGQLYSILRIIKTAVLKIYVRFQELYVGTTKLY
jgi:hypothetical protein